MGVARCGDVERPGLPVASESLKHGGGLVRSRRSPEAASRPASDPSSRSCVQGTSCPAQAPSVPGKPPPPARASRGPVTSSPEPRRGGESRRTPSNSSSIAAGSNPSAALATTNTRRRRWASRLYWASRTRHATALWGPRATPAFVHFGTWTPRFLFHDQNLPAFPSLGRGPGSRGSLSPASPARKQPRGLSSWLSTPGTFSQRTTQGGRPSAARTSSIALTRSMKARVSWPRASLRPPRSPAIEKAWQGVPAMTTSGAGISRRRTFAASSVMSPWLGVPGKRCASTLLAAASTSAHQRDVHPRRAKATSGAPIPEQAVAKVTMR